MTLTLVMLFVLSLGLALTVTPLVARLAVKINALDLPGERKLHSSPVPRLGGIAIYLGFIISLNLGLLLSDSLLELFMASPRMWIGLLFGGSLILALGIVDDIYQITPRTKLLFQVSAAFIVYLSGLHITSIANPFNGVIHLGWLALPATLLWIVGITNAMNLIDGLDGLASGVALIITGTLLCISLSSGKFGTAVVCTLLCGSTLGFLRYNFNPARIFMGDSGSMFLGFTLAIIALKSTEKSTTAVAILIPLLFFGLPIADMAMAVCRRLFSLGGRGVEAPYFRVFRADREHIHHKLIDLGFSQRTAVLTLYTVTLGLSAFGFLLTVNRNEKLALFLAIAFLVAFGLLLGFTVLKSRSRKNSTLPEPRPSSGIIPEDVLKNRT